MKVLIEEKKIIFFNTKEEGSQIPKYHALLAGKLKELTQEMGHQLNKICPSLSAYHFRHRQWKR